MIEPRKPLARLERRDVQRTFRLSESEDRMLQAGAVEDEATYTEYCRACMLTGHMIKQSQRLMKHARA